MEPEQELEPEAAYGLEQMLEPNMARDLEQKLELKPMNLVNFVAFWETRSRSWSWSRSWNWSRNQGWSQSWTRRSGDNAWIDSWSENWSWGWGISADWIRSV